MTQEELLNKILAEVVDVKESFREFRETELDEKLVALKSEIFVHIDGFIRLHQTLVLEFTALRSHNARLEERLKKVEMKLGIAVEA